MSYNTYLREQIDWNVTQDVIGYFDASDNYVFKRSYNQWIQAYPPAVFTGENLVLPNTPLTTHEKKPLQVLSPPRGKRTMEVKLTTRAKQL